MITEDTVPVPDRPNSELEVSKPSAKYLTEEQVEKLKKRVEELREILYSI